MSNEFWAGRPAGRGFQSLADQCASSCTRALGLHAAQFSAQFAVVAAIPDKWQPEGQLGAVSKPLQTMCAVKGPSRSVKWSLESLVSGAFDLLQWLVFPATLKQLSLLLLAGHQASSPFTIQCSGEFLLKSSPKGCVCSGN
jgi:hypothetical protein